MYNVKINKQKKNITYTFKSKEGTMQLEKEKYVLSEENFLIIMDNLETVAINNDLNPVEVLDQIPMSLALGTAAGVALFLASVNNIIPREEAIKNIVSGSIGVTLGSFIIKSSNYVVKSHQTNKAIKERNKIENIAINSNWYDDIKNINRQHSIIQKNAIITNYVYKK